jgi:hypothetical protein
MMRGLKVKRGRVGLRTRVTADHAAADLMAAPALGPIRITRGENNHLRLPCEVTVDRSR